MTNISQKRIFQFEILESFYLLSAGLELDQFSENDIFFRVKDHENSISISVHTEKIEHYSVRVLNSEKDSKFIKEVSELFSWAYENQSYMIEKEEEFEADLLDEYLCNKYHDSK